MKNFKIVITVLLILSLAVMINYGIQGSSLVTAENPFGLKGIGLRPAGEKLVGIDMEKDQKELALELYKLACEKDKNAPFRAFSSICPTSNVVSSMDNRILLNILEIKNQGEFFRIDYRLKDSIPLFTVAPALEITINKLLQLVTTERRYYNIDMEHTLYQQVLNANTDENGSPYANWSVLLKEIEQDPYIIHSSQEEEYTKSAHIIDIDTISTASVTYHADSGLYVVKLSLDVSSIDPELGANKATLNTLPYIKEGASSQDAHYTVIDIDFEIWDNGYFKTFNTLEKWQGTVALGLKVSSDFHYRDTFSYNESDCDISRYYKDGAFVD